MRWLSRFLTRKQPSPPVPGPDPSPVQPEASPGGGGETTDSTEGAVPDASGYQDSAEPVESTGDPTERSTDDSSVEHGFADDPEPPDDTRNPVVDALSAPEVRDRILFRASIIDWRDKWLAHYSTAYPVRGSASPAHLAFHRDRRRGRVLIGSNKSGKTYAAALELAMWLLGCHIDPERGFPKEPVRARVTAPDLPQGLQIPHVQRDMLISLIPEACAKGGAWETAWAAGGHVLWLANGSCVEFLSSHQTMRDHAGQNLHCVWMDEDLPREIFVEDTARLSLGGFGGSWWLTYVPLVTPQSAWMIDEFGNPETCKAGLHHVTMKDNAHNLATGFEEEFGASILPSERLARVEGKYGGSSDRLVFPDPPQTGEFGGFDL